MRIPKMVSCFGRVCAPWLIVFISARITSKTRVTALAVMKDSGSRSRCSVLSPRCKVQVSRARSLGPGKDLFSCLGQASERAKPAPYTAGGAGEVHGSRMRVCVCHVRSTGLDTHINLYTVH